MIKTLKTHLLSSIKSKKINVFLLFLLSAFIILIFNKLSKEYTNTLVFSVEKQQVPLEHVILNDSANVLAITLKTHGFRWLNYYMSKPKIKIDFAKDVYRKDSAYVWHKSIKYLANTQFDDQVELLNISPDTLYFKYGVNLVKTVPIQLKSDIKFALGYDISGDYNLKPDSVTIIGPDVLVSKLDFIDTKLVTLADVKTNIIKNLALDFPNTTDLKFSTDLVTLSANVGKFTEGKLKVPIEIINIPENLNIKYFPKEINVSYYVSLNNFNSVTVKDFKVVCDYSKVGKGSTLTPELVERPEQVKNAKINQQLIEFIITK
ncbi:CdaR family protein [Algibacter pacificus]|uniref:CdaR family protein n=1 Tax=Algibacter pacificus TaxID=2599389 RepID=UPI001FEC5EB7|nr:YbbR-like domain-containing protein [Algibacter pacificus]